ncbi:MAG: glycosyltransferase [Bacteroidota bacterium]
MTKPRTLIILTPGFPTSETDTNCLPAQQSLVRCFNTCFPELRLLILSFQYPHTTLPYQWNGNTVIPLGGNNRGGVHRRLLWCKAWIRLSALIKKENCIGLLSFWLGECALAGHYINRFYKIPHISWLLGQDAKTDNRFAQKIISGKTVLAAISEHTAALFLRNYGTGPAHIIPNGIEAALFSENHHLRDIDIIGAGSLIPLKRYDLFIEIIHQLHQHIPGLKVLLCGQGPEETSLKKLIRQYQLDTVITLTGEIDHTQMLSLMQRSRMLLHTSSFEGFSGACLEALYAGAHVFSFFGAQQKPIAHWHIVPDEVNMPKEILAFLHSSETDHAPVMAYSMLDSAVQFMELFGQERQTDPVQPVSYRIQ